MAEATTLPTANRKQLGKQLRAVRRRKGLSLSEVARGAGLSRRELVSYERGKIEIPGSDLWVLAGSCGVDVSELVPPVETPALAAAPSTIEDTITQLRGGQEDYAINRHLDTLAALRALPPGSSVQLQDRERESMVDALGRDPGTIEKRLVDRMHISRDEAARLRELILPSAPRYSPLALEAAASAPAPEPAPAPPAAAAPETPQAVAPPAAPPADDLLAEPPAPLEEETWFADGANFDTETPSGPVDVFEELARLPEPAPLPTDEEARDLLAPPPEPVTAAAAAVAATEHASFSEWQSVRSALPEPTESVLVESPPNAAAAAVAASDSPPIDVSTRLDDHWGGSWNTATSASATSAPAPTDAPRYDPTSWEPPPPPSSGGSWSAPGPEAVVPLEIVEFVDDYVDQPSAAAGNGYDTTELTFDRPRTDADRAADETDGAATAWERRLDPGAASSGFYVDWGTGDTELEPTASPWDPPAATDATAAFEGSDALDLPASDVELDEPETPDAWDPTPSWEPTSWEPRTAEDSAPSWDPPAWPTEAAATETPSWETPEPAAASRDLTTEPQTEAEPEPEPEPEPEASSWAPATAPEAPSWDAPSWDAPSWDAPSWEAPSWDAPAPSDAAEPEDEPVVADTGTTLDARATLDTDTSAEPIIQEGPAEAPEVELAPISWRPLVDPRTGQEDVAASTAAVVASVASALGTLVEPGSELAFEPIAVARTPEPEPEPEIAPVVEPEATEQFVVAGAEWELGNAVPLVEVRNQGGLVMRRADERWALADLTTTPDFALEVEVDFRSGPGFGVLFRASTDADGHMSGYSFDVDPIHEGGSFLVRQWQADRELWNPLARVAATDPGAMHGHLTLRVTVVDDTLTASVNGERVLEIESLGQACADRNREPATGNRVGIQAWSSSDLVVDTLRAAEH